MIRILIAAAVAMVASLGGTRLLIAWLSRRRIGQPIRDDGPDGHATKGGSAALPLLDDAQWRRRRRGALYVRPCRRNQTHHTSTTAC